MRRASLTVLALGALFAGSCGPGKLIVGVVMPETGVNRGYGQSLEAGAKLVFDNAVAKQSPPGFQARYRDSLSHPEYAAKEAKELFNEGAWIVVGGATSAEARAIIPEADQANRIVISPSASEPGLAGTSNLFFRVYPSDNIEAAEAASFLITHRKAGTILVLYESGVYGEGVLKVFTDEVAKLHGKIPQELPIGPTDWDKAITDALQTKKPDAVFIGAYAEETLAALAVIRAARFPGTVCATSAFADGDVIKRAGALADGVFLPIIKVDMTSQEEPIKSFVARYKAAHNGELPDLFSAYGYDAATVAVNALQGPRPKDTSELLVRVMSQGSQRGVTGKLGFDADGDTVNRPRIYCIKSGQFENCDPWPLP
jgi:ABC-type branched-subunit amino acid transport system substrate-binding protein